MDRSHRGPAQPVVMTWSSAALIAVVRAYVEARAAAEPWTTDRGASALEIQKLMYFANVAAPQLGLTFRAARYGPYSEQVRHLLQDMEGSLLEGFGDGSEPVLSLVPIGPTAEGRDRAAAFDDEHGGSVASDVVEPTLTIVEGFEGAYGLELLATVHWVLTESDLGTDPAAVTREVRRWSARKGRLFTEDHVRTAMERLGTLELTPA